MSEYVIDAKDLIVGRMATKVAKAALLGDKIHVVNADLAVLSGRKEVLLKKWKHRMDMGQPQQGPYVQRRPDRFVRRAIRGMLPYKQPKGKEAFGRVMCYIGVPPEFEGKEMKTVEGAHLKKLPNLKYLTIKQLCQEIGGFNG